jgi:hypothetical protein
VLSDSLLVAVIPSSSGHGYEGTLHGSKVRVLRITSYPEGNLRNVTEVRLACHVSPISQRLQNPQALRHAAIVWKYLTHRNIAPLLGVTLDPLQFVSDWTSDEDLNGYVINHPDADKLSLVCFPSTALCAALTPSPAI